MEKLTTISRSVFFALACTTTSALAQNPVGPRYADDETQQLVEQMLEAHGGIDRWIEAPQVRFTAGMYLASLPINEARSYYDNWRYYRVTVEPKTSRGYVELPLEEQTGPALGYNGSELWAREYNFDPSYRDSPFQLLFMHYGWISLPWLTHQPEVSLQTVEPSTLPGSDIQHDVVEMTFSPKDKLHGGFFRLYIHPETKRLGGFTQTVGYPFLPGDVIPQNLGGQESTGGVFRVIDAYTEVDGLVLPKSYYTVRVDGQETQLMGAHLVIDPTFAGSFDESQISRPNESRILTRKPTEDIARYTASRTQGPGPTIDGELHDGVWSTAHWNETFFTPAGGDPTQRTSFALMYDDTYLYIGLELNDVDPAGITQTPGERDDTEGDRIAAFFDTNTDGTTTKVFVINAAGVVRDQTSTENGTAWDNSWDTEWTSAHYIGGDGWSAELRIPFASLGLNTPRGGEWGFQLSRVVTRLSEQSFWSRPNPSRGFVGSFGRVLFGSD